MSRSTRVLHRMVLLGLGAALLWGCRGGAESVTEPAGARSEASATPASASVEGTDEAVAPSPPERPLAPERPVLERLALPAASAALERATGCRPGVDEDCVVGPRADMKTLLETERPLVAPSVVRVSPAPEPGELPPRALERFGGALGERPRAELRGDAHVAITSDGALIACSDDRIQIFGRDDGRLRAEHRREGSECRGISGDGARVLWCGPRCKSLGLAVPGAPPEEDVALPPQLREVAFSADGKRLLARDGGKIVAHAVASGKRLWSHTPTPTTATTVPPGHFALSGDGSLAAYVVFETVTVLDDRGKELYHFVADSSALALAFSADGARLATMSKGIVRVFAGRTGVELHHAVIPFTPWGSEALAFDRDGDHLVAFDGATLSSWSHTLELEASAPVSYRVALVTDPVGGGVAMVNADGYLRLWDPEQAEMRWGAIGHDTPITAIMPTATAGHLLTLDEQRGACWWTPGERLAPRCLRGPDVWVSPERAAYLLGREVHVLEADRLARVGVLEVRPEQLSKRSGQLAAALSQDGRSLVLVLPGDGIVRRIETDTLEQVHDVPNPPGFDSDWARIVRAAAGGSRLLTTDLDGRFGVLGLEAASFALLEEAPRNNGATIHAISPDGRYVVTEDGELELFDGATGVLLDTVRDLTLWDDVTFVHGGEVLVGLPGLRAWAIGEGLVELWAEPSLVGPVAASPDGRWLASPNRNNDLEIRQLADGVLVETLAASALRFESRRWPARISALAWATDGTLIAGHDDGTLVVWAPVTTTAP